MKLRKRLLCAVLALLMLCALSSAALAEDEGPEIVEEEPAVTEEPADLTAPAADGYTVDGVVHASDLPPLTDVLTLQGSTVLVVDKDLTLTKITGNHPLQISVHENRSLHIANPNGTCIDTWSLSVVGPGSVVLEGDGEGVDVCEDAVIEGGPFTIRRAGYNGIRCEQGNITVNCKEFRVESSGSCALYALGGSIFVLQGGMFQADEFAIRAERGNISLSGIISAGSAGSAIFAKNGKITSNACLTVISTRGTESTPYTGSYVISAEKGIEFKNEYGAYVVATGNYGGIYTSGGAISVYSDASVEAKKTPAFHAPTGSLNFYSGSISAKGTLEESADDEGIYGRLVHVYPEASLTAVGRFYGIRGNTVVIEGPTSAGAYYPRAYNGLWVTGVEAQELTIGAPLTASGYDYAVRANTITLKPGCTFETPLGGRIVGDTIQDSLGQTSRIVIISHTDYIRVAAVTELDAPAVGAAGDTAVTVPADAHYTVQGVSWYDMTVPTGKPLTGNWTFKAEHAYSCNIVLQPKEGYAFHEKAAATVNGKTPDAVNVLGTETEPGKYLSLTVDFPALEKPLIHIPSASVAEIDDPVVGQSCDPTLSVPTGEGYKLTNYYWFDCDDPDTVMTAFQTFEAGHEYGVRVELTAQEGYVFDEDAFGIFDGGDPDFVTVSPDGKTMCIEYRWPVLESEAPAVTIAPDGKTALVTGNFQGLYARAALILDNNGVSGLYVTQTAIGADGTVTVPSMMVPGLVVKGVNIALVPTIPDIQSAVPTVIASDFRML